MITPTHLYHVKTGTRKLNGASQIVVQNCSSSSPPIPTSSFQLKKQQTRLNSRYNTNSKVQQTAEEILNNNSVRNDYFDEEDEDDFEDEQPFIEDAAYDDFYGSDSDDDDDDDEDDNSYHEQPDLRSQFYAGSSITQNDEEKQSTITSSTNTVQFYEEDEELEGSEMPTPSASTNNMLSGLSEEEDDSDMEEELELAVQQIKSKPSTASGGEDSLTSPSRPHSNNTSPRAPRKHKNSNSSLASKRYVSRQRSFDVGPINKTHNSNTVALTEKSPRRMSVPTKVHTSHPTGRRLTPDLGSQKLRRPTDPGPPILESAATVSINYSETTLAAQEKLELGFGLRDLPVSTAPSSLVSSTQPLTTTRTLKRMERSSSIFSQITKKPIPPSQVGKSSLLTSQIKVKESSEDNPLEEYINASGKSEQKPLKLKMYMPSCDEPRKPWEVIVRTDVAVSTAIGFALYCYMEEKRMPSLPEDMCNANKWTLRIVEDDGEPDEDFPALDRTRLLSAYSFDEFALVEATPSQVADHEKITPTTRKAKKPTAYENLENTQQSAEPEPEEPPENVTLRVYQYPFDDMVSALYWTNEVSINTEISEIQYHVCVDKGLDRNQYVMKIAGKRSVLQPTSKVAALEGQHNLELTPRRIVNKMNGYDELLGDLQVIKKSRSASVMGNTQPVQSVQPQPSGGLRSSLSLKRTSVTLTAPFNFRTSTDDDSKSNRLSFGSSKPGAGASSVPGNATALRLAGIQVSAEATAHSRAASNARASMMVPPMLPETLNAIGFQKYKIWRRQPMSFIQRHERVLALDGEYVHIMPSDDRAWYDYSPKTSTFHISQMIKCKMSRKIQNNFKVVVVKSTGVTKRYDLEAMNSTQAHEIVAKLKGLLSSYQMNKDSSRRH